MQYFSQQHPEFEIADKAECMRMCSDDELHFREVVEVSSVSPFEKNDKGEHFELLGIKNYQRSAADKVMNAPNKIRPPQILLKCVEYLRDCIADLDRL